MACGVSMYVCLCGYYCTMFSKRQSKVLRWLLTECGEKWEETGDGARTCTKLLCCIVLAWESCKEGISCS